MEPKRLERTDPLAFFPRQGLEPPTVYPPVYRIKVARDLDGPRPTVRLAQHLAVRWDKARVED
jgi:hypothetical protein